MGDLIYIGIRHRFIHTIKIYTIASNTTFLLLLHRSTQRHPGNPRLHCAHQALVGRFTRP